MKNKKILIKVVLIIGLVLIVVVLYGVGYVEEID